jgi:dTDP-4-dehydrorhamnose 3,5-epimerase-like enzyme
MVLERKLHRNSHTADRTPHKQRDMSIKNCRWIDLQTVIDGKDGCISIAENFVNIPFAIKRVYYIYNLGDSNALRGMHAHKNLEQVLFCIKGSFTLSLDNGESKTEIIMDKVNKGIYLGIDVWLTMRNFSEDCIILVLASELFNEDDYIRNYDEFINYIKSKNDSL